MDEHAFVGKRIGDYLIEEFKTAGGQASVFRARHEMLKKTLALKIYGPFLELRAIEPALEEARRQSDVDHPAVLKIHPPFIESDPVDETQHLLVIPMPYSSSGSAETWSEFRDRVGVSQIEQLRDLFDGVRAIHEAGLTHNDLKPSNLLLFPDAVGRPRLQISDFGIARLIGPLMQVSALSPPFAPPEQFDGECSERGDIYSLGATVFFLLTGQLPITPDQGVSGADSESWKRAHLSLPRPDAAQFNEKCTARLALLLIRMMSREKAGRPNIVEALEELDRALREIQGDEGGYPVGRQFDKILVPPKAGIRYETSSCRKVFAPEVHATFNRSLWIVRIRLPTYRWDYLGRVFRLCVHFFSEAFSLCETYGQHDILVRVWSGEKRLQAFLNQIRLDTGTLEVDEHLVEEVIYPGRQRVATNVELTRTISLALQEDVEPFGNLYRRALVGELPKEPAWKVKAYTFVEPGRSLYRSPHRTDIIAGLKYRAASIFESGSAQALYILTERCTYLCMIEFGVESFNSLWEVPAGIVDPEKGAAFGTTTLLATNRLVYESDQIRL